MPTLCETFEFLAERSWWYLEAATAPELRIGEETLTDINLIDMQYRHPAEVVTEKFSKQMEAQNGADWEWWLIFGGRTLGLRLQAKKLYPEGMYLSLSGPGPRNQLQALITQALADGLWPLYCFYNQRNPADPSEWPLLGSSPIEQMGCGLAGAAAVKAVVVDARRSPTVDNLARHQVPWRNLVCGIGGMGSSEGPSDEGPSEDGPFEGGPVAGGPIEGIQARLRELAGDLEGPEPDIRDVAELPEYVQLVRTREAAAYRDLVPARRVTVFDFDAAERL
jgi:hypothetical protein